MEDLKKRSIKVTVGMPVFWPQHNQAGQLDLSSITSAFADQKVYAVNDSTLAFICDDIIYVTPYTRQVVEKLKANDYQEKSFYVPFSHGDRPEGEPGLKWKALRKLAREIYKQNLVEDCSIWCKEHQINPLPTDVLDRCFKIPPKGFVVEHPYFTDRCYPKLDPLAPDYQSLKYLGQYCYSNGRVIFVASDGNTYISKGYWVLTALEKAGFKEGNFLVPLSNGERIIDPALASLWDSIPEY